MFALEGSAFDTVHDMVMRDPGDAHGLLWIDRFLDELAVDSNSSGSSSSSDVADNVSSDVSMVDTILAGKAPQTHDERKKLHRESMARLRSERRTRIGRLDAQETRLHRQLRHALAFFQRHHQTAHDDTTPPCPCKAYVALVQESERLRDEQYALEHQRHAWKRYIKLVTVESERTSEATRTDFTSEVNPEEPPLVYVEESLEMCGVVVTSALGEIARTKMALMSSTSAVSADCLGWRVDQRIDDGDTSALLQVRMAGRVAGDHASLHGLQHRTWEMLRDRTPRVSPLLGNDKVVQTLDSNAFITRGRAPTSSQVCLTARDVAEDGHAVTLIVAPLDTTALPEHAWRRGVWALRFTRIEAETSGGCDAIEVECVFRLECEDVAHAARQGAAFRTALLQWELEAMPPPPRLPVK